MSNRLINYYKFIEMSRRKQTRPSFPSLQMINSSNYLPVEIVERDEDDNLSFSFIYLETPDLQELEASIKAEDNISGRVYLELIEDNAFLKRYHLKRSYITKNLCNYSLKKG